MLTAEQEHETALLARAGKFEAERGFRFSTDASWWIRQAVERALMQESLLKLRKALARQGVNRDSLF